LRFINDPALDGYFLLVLLILGLIFLKYQVGQYSAIIIVIA